MSRALIWLVLIIPVTAGGLLWLLQSVKELPDESRSIHIDTAALFLGAKTLPIVNATPQRMVSLPHNWREDVMVDHAWYRLKVPLEVPPNRLWGIFLGEIEQNAALYLNGEIIGSRGSMSEYPSRYNNQALYFALPNGLLQSGINRLDILVRSYPPGRGYLGVVVLGPDEVLRPFHARRVFVKSDLLWFFVTLSLGMTLVMLVLAWLRPGQTVYLWFAMQSTFWTLMTAISLMLDPPVSHPWALALRSVFSTWFCACALMFALRFTDTSRKWLETLILSAAALGTVVLVIVATVEPTSVFRITPLSTMLQMMFGPIVLAYVVQQFVRTKDPELFVLLYTGGMVMIFGFFSMSVSVGLRSGAGGQYLFYITPLLMGACVFLLIRRFVLAVSETEELNLTLERRIDRKSTELEENYLKLSNMQREKTLSEERERIMRDMHDGVGGQLVNSLMRLKSLGIQDQGVSEVLENALTDLRLMIDSLEVGEGDLNVALGMLRQRLQPQLASVGLQIIWKVDELPPVEGFSPHAVLQVMRIVQEAITNVLKHADARQVIFTAHAQASEVVLSIADDGNGFDNVENTDGRGLGNMRERARDIGATLSLNSDQRGTLISLHLPLTTLR